MQIIYAAPFLALAAICFLVCAAISGLRKSALIVPVGILSFGPGSLISYAVFALVAYKLGYKGPANWWYLAPYIVGGLAIAICCSLVWRNIVAVLALWAIRVGLVAATFSSLLVLLPFCSWGVAHFVTLDREHLRWMTIPGLLCFSIASLISWQLVRIAEQFQPTQCGPTIFKKPLSKDGRQNIAPQNNISPPSLS